ncbi:MAG: hypothetical protein FJ107_00400 [Deltaproteobacteria bacterium]|nr:hypothetical protein [Deltaproteobacteria bacterium]MBM4346572.1 hypothetical protein [Deltaproteobacteria bacterium]
MLNELVVLYNALVSLGCDFGTPHPHFRKCPKGKAAFKLSLDEFGKVSDIVAMTDFNIEEVYRWQEHYHTPTFPAFNARALFEIPDPIPAFSIDNEKEILAFIEDLTNPRNKSIGNVKKEALEELETKCNGLWSDDIVWIGKCLKETPDTLRSMIGEIPRSYQALQELIRRAGICKPEELQRSVWSILRQKLIDTGDKVYAEALFAFKKKGKKKRRGKEHGKDYLYLLTIEDWNKYPSDTDLEKYPPYHLVIQNWMRMQLESYSDKNYPPTGKPDAYGRDFSGATENFAPANVGGLGPTVPFTANDQIPCLERYGLEGSSLFPAGAETRKMALKGIDYILNRTREGVTWKNITKYEPSKNKRKTVVIAYCTCLRDVNTLQFFDREDDDPKENIYRSEAATKLALAPFDGITKERPDARVVIHLLSAVDPGNTKVLASRKYSLFELSEGAFRWQAGNANIPGLNLPWVSIKQKRTSGENIRTKDAVPVYPIEAIKILNTDWYQDGKMVTQSKRFLPDEALDFLFEKGEVIGQRIDSGLSLLVEKSSSAIISAGLKGLHDYRKTGIKIKFTDNLFLHMLPSLYGLFLYKKGIKKEDYMNETMFYLGRYFAVVDDLYIQYHKDNSSGKVPMSLLGNDHMKLALQNPREAFVTLSSRLAHPYISWAKRVGTNDKPGRIAKNCIRKIGELTGELSKGEIPTDIKDTDKAKLLLGYLSYGARKDQFAGDSNEEKNEEGGEL